jgi:hypothetical protein
LQKRLSLESGPAAKVLVVVFGLVAGLVLVVGVRKCLQRRSVARQQAYKQSK